MKNIVISSLLATTFIVFVVMPNILKIETGDATAFVFLLIFTVSVGMGIFFEEYINT
jgi:hypothetical protein